MRNIFIFAMPFLCFSFFVSTVRGQSRSNYVTIEVVGLGVSANLAGTKTGTNSNLLSSQSDFGFSTKLLKVTHLFSPKLGWYAGINTNFFKEKKSPYYDASVSDAIGEFAVSLFYGGYIPSPIVEGGLVYRIQKNKWDINPSLGYGYGSILLDRDSDKAKVNSDGSLERAIYKQRIGSSVLNLGIGANYFFGKRSFIALNTTLSQPLQRSYAELSIFKDDVQTEFREFSSSSIGRNLNVTIGYGFFIGNRNVSE